MKRNPTLSIMILLTSIVIGFTNCGKKEFIHPSPEGPPSQSSDTISNQHPSDTIDHPVQDSIPQNQHNQDSIAQQHAQDSIQHWNYIQDSLAHQSYIEDSLLHQQYVRDSINQWRAHQDSVRNAQGFH